VRIHLYDSIFCGFLPPVTFMHPSTPLAILRRVHLSAFLITNAVNIRYLSGAEISAGALLAQQDGYHLFVDGRYGEAAAHRLRPGVQVHERAELAVFLRKIRRCGCEAETVTLAQYGRWKRQFKNTKFIQVTDAVGWFRRSKDPEERAAFRRAQRITRAMLRKIPAVLRSGITERALVWKLTEWAHALGADGLAFDPIVAFGSHTSRPHHHATDRRLKKGDLVQVDVGARFHGYCADQSAVFFTGKPTELQQKVLVAVRQAQKAVLKSVAAGVSTHQLDRTARCVLREHGFEEYFVHSLGHGVGLEIHEGVTLSEKRPAEKLLEHEIITIEPGVYLPGKFGIRLECEVMVGEK